MLCPEDLCLVQSRLENCFHHSGDFSRVQSGVSLESFLFVFIFTQIPNREVAVSSELGHICLSPHSWHPSVSHIFLFLGLFLFPGTVFSIFGGAALSGSADSVQCRVCKHSWSVSWWMQYISLLDFWHTMDCARNDYYKSRNICTIFTLCF